MELTHKLAVVVGHALKNVHAGKPKLASARLGRNGTHTLDVSSPSFCDGCPLPGWTTADGRNVPPSIQWSRVPPSTKSVVLLCEDPDAPFPEPFVHWMAYGIPASAHRIGREYADCAWLEGKNSKLANGYTGAAPPPGHGAHRYHFQVFALDIPTPFDAGIGRAAMEKHMTGHVIAWGELVGTCERY